MTAIEPGERAQAMLRIAEEALTATKYDKAQAAFTGALAYLEAVRLDRQEQAQREAAKDALGRRGWVGYLTSGGRIPLPEDSDAAP